MFKEAAILTSKSSVPIFPDKVQKDFPKSSNFLFSHGILIKKKDVSLSRNLVLSENAVLKRCRSKDSSTSSTTRAITAISSRKISFQAYIVD